MGGPGMDDMFTEGDDPLPEGEKTMEDLEVLKLWIKENNKDHSCPKWDTCCQYNYAPLVVKAITRLQELGWVDKVDTNPGIVWRAHWSYTDGGRRYVFESRDFETLDELLFPAPEDPE